MSNRDDDFDDLFSDDDDFNFDNDDDLFGGLDDDEGLAPAEFDPFEREDRQADPDRDLFQDYDERAAGEVQLDLDEDEGEEAAGGGRSPFFVIAAILLVLIILGGGAFLVTQLIGDNEQQQQLEETRAAIVATNQAVEQFLTETEEANIANSNATATADAFTDTPTPTFTPSDTPTPTVDTASTETAVFAATSNAAGTATALVEEIQQTSQAQLNATITAQFLTAEAQNVTPPTMAPTDTPTDDAGPTDEPTPTREGVSVSAVQQTATALALILRPDLITPADGDGGVTPIPGRPTPRPDLPDTGIFDDVVGTDPGMIALAAFGLLGVIFISRGLRSANRKRR
jgi:cytoskeletal protein RodZ